MEDFRDRPPTLDQFGTRLSLYPAEVRGQWRTRRTRVQAVLIVIFLILPWIHVNGAPAVLVDLDRHRFAFFGLKLWAHDAPLLFPVLGLFATGLAVMTALVGRAWCGWACPQTVFLDGVIRRIERWTEGTHLQRRALDAGPFSFEKFRKKFFKWTLFVAFTGLLTHSFLAYFFGADRVMDMMTRDPRENAGPFLFILAVNGLMLFDLAWFREQFCLIVCPYGRIQSVLMDRQTIAVQYDSDRGEPRKTKGAATHGACVNCNRCVSVCPTGIDIRNGVQLECISCTACIDACDDVMKKTNQPLGLISHRPLTKNKVNWFRPRVSLYLVAMVALASTLIFALNTHDRLTVAVLRALDTPYFEQTEADGRQYVVNSYRLHAHNQTSEKIHVAVTMAPIPNLETRLRLPESMLDLNAGESRMIPFTVEIPKAELQGRSMVPLKFQIQEQNYEVEFVAPRS